MRTALHLIGLALTWGLWLGLATQSFAPAVSLALAMGGVLAVVPLVYAGRWLLDHQPTVQRAEQVTTGIHYLLAIFLGSAVVEATKLGLASPAWPIPVPAWLGMGIMVLGGLGVLFAILNLVLKGLGVPFAVALTRLVAEDWLYAWTRNPMVLSGLAFLIGLGLWLRSGLFLLWVLAVVGPAILLALKVYEERELEIRFGAAYLDYKARTPMLWPRRPQEPDDRQR